MSDVQVPGGELGEAPEAFPPPRATPDAGYLPIEDYLAIGDGRTLALVGRDGSIDWMCLPELDSPSVFGALLDPLSGGRFALAPAIPFRSRQEYVAGTNVAETTFETAEGTVRVTDAVTLDSPRAAPWRELVRRVEAVSGSVPMRWRWEPAFAYGRGPHGGEAGGERIGDALVVRGPDGLQLALRTWGAGRGDFTARLGEPALLVMTAVTAAPLPVPVRAAAERRLAETTGVWRRWLARHGYDGPWREAVDRSLLALGLLADARTGAIAAAGTTSLPEVLGGSRNYDYRFGWVRDASFTLDALLAVGMEEMTHGSLTWLLDAVHHTHPRVDPVYSLNGEVIRSQSRVPLPGYAWTTPVHVGNQAGSQLQLGGYGDLLQTIWRYVAQGHVLTPELGERLADAVDLVCHLWRCPDAGLWELSQTARYGTSALGCWVAVDRLLDLVARGQVPARHVERWRRERAAMAAFIDAELWSDRRRSYVQAAGSEDLDCGMLLAARRGYGDPAGERMQATIDTIRAQLGGGGPLLYRYSGMPQQENCFLACSFWMAEALALAGRRDEAAEMMDALVALGAVGGLYSEEMEPSERRMRGNVPQALTHLSLISAAVAIAGD